jgi:4-hydroxy-tetrahydrodipicolinate reductase
VRKEMTAQDFSIALPGAAGRMGQMIQTVLAEQNITLKAATEDKSSDKIGTKMMGVTVSDDSAALGQGSGCVIVDFTRPEVTMAHLAIARSTATPMVIGTTGLSASDEQKIAEAASDIPVVYCANTSVGVTLLSRIVSDVARALSDDWDIEIVETHHHHKIDAPSGTALALGHAAAKGRGVSLDAVRDSGRDGETGARKKGDIGFAVLRGGDVAGEHTVSFFGQQERIEITHRATGRIIFARGAVEAARFAASAPNGLYDMTDVLGLSSD